MSTTRRRSRTADSAASLRRRPGRALVHPVFFGSAITGAGVEALIEGITELLPAAEGDADGPVSGAVFKVERGPAGEKIAYVRMFSGTVRMRDRLRFGRDEEGKVTAISVFDRGSAVQRVGRRRADREALGSRRRPDRRHDRRIADDPREPLLRAADAGDGRRSPPTRRQGRAARRAGPTRRAGPADQPAPGRCPAGDIRLALRRGAEGGHPGDAGERLRHRRRVPRDDDDLRRAARRHRRGGRVDPRGTSPTTPFLATVGLRVEPAPIDSGVEFGLDVEVRLGADLHLQDRRGVSEAMERYVRETLREGLYGWQVTDCSVTMIDCGYQAPPQTWPGSTASDFRSSPRWS